MQRFTRRFLAACAFSGVVASSAALAENQPTIRAMSGATPTSQLPVGKTALLVIDFQNEYFTGKMPIPDGAAALANTRRLIAFADDHKMPVFHVQHIAPAGSAVFAKDGETVKFHPDMQPRAKDVVLQKTTVSVFGSTDLDKRLKRAGIENLIISGLMTHACVAGAARDAAPLGYNVLVASDASATRAITRGNGEAIDKDALHKAALAEVEDTFGDVMTTEQIIKLPVR
ncbi:MULTISPECIES: cysteine hydrolase family protein [unclassified Pseudomonas]|uniref:cysteine hydrolase family protein n=1 Tax=unclassified Pseudomonas TaxID=196821 RepID=UPI0011A6B4C2|nr:MULTISPECIES: cysteine hydrolase family protein [unclassified Pseudomonas]TWC21182.1 nicotinamidase-related amidase [Pseudomonas sp. SJZ075]TWC36662.1 nicotinamidase-related amidase [Pseudomonas sp. SJZ078]TWC57421.1 nicotinamidase-related amidase [Pseudomonas sp. SJZ124]TWC92282.1 nicotinamidase-related amidase [Pseudomonas sp. SJZ101]